MGRQNWAWGIKHVLLSIGFGHVWYMQSVGNVNVFVFRLKQRLIDIGFQYLDSNVTESFEQHLQFTPFDKLPSYVLHCTYQRERRIIALLRTFSLPLKCNLERWKLELDSICNRCSFNLIDDEYHFLFECVALTKLRMIY